MKILSVGLSACLLLLLTACDAKDDYNKPKTEARSMIIGGVPVYDQDYRLAQLNVRENSPVVEP